MNCKHCHQAHDPAEMIGDACAVCYNRHRYGKRSQADDKGWRDRVPASWGDSPRWENDIMPAPPHEVLGGKGGAA